jgi:hypothetical protein
MMVSTRTSFLTKRVQRKKRRDEIIRSAILGKFPVIPRLSLIRRKRKIAEIKGKGIDIMMMNGVLITTKIKEIIYCLNIYCPYWLEMIGLAAVVIFN